MTKEQLDLILEHVDLSTMEFNDRMKIQYYQDLINEKMSFRDKLDNIYSDIVKQHVLNDDMDIVLDLIDDLQNEIESLTPKS